MAARDSDDHMTLKQATRGCVDGLGNAELTLSQIPPPQTHCTHRPPSWIHCTHFPPPQTSLPISTSLSVAMYPLYCLLATATTYTFIFLYSNSDQIGPTYMYPCQSKLVHDDVMMFYKYHHRRYWIYIYMHVAAVLTNNTQYCSAAICMWCYS